jgi:hypothetical protein
MRSLILAAMVGPADEPEERSGVLDAARSGDLPAFEQKALFPILTAHVIL